MKKLLTMLLCLAMAFTCAFGVAACTPGYRGLKFRLNADNASYTVAGIGSCTDTDVVIPSEYNGLPVTSIGDGAFYGCTSLANITIGDSVTSIGISAFTYCSSLASVTIGDSVTTIGDAAFAGSGLTSIVVPDSVTSIGSSAFNYCTSLASITVDLNNSVYHSSGNCLIETDSKTLIAGCNTSVIPVDGSVTSIGDGAFYGCTGLANITIGDSVTTIGDQAFSYCRSLASITIPDSVTIIGDQAFEDCSSLTSIVIPDSVTSIGDTAFVGCDSLTTVCYTGSEAEWKQIVIGSDNDDLLDAEIVFNYKGE